MLPTACAILNESQLRSSDIPLGLITAALPLVLPFARLAQTDAALPTLDVLGVGMRVGALLLPVLLLLLTYTRAKTAIKFFVCVRRSVVVVCHRVWRIPRSAHRA